MYRTRSSRNPTTPRRAAASKCLKGAKGPSSDGRCTYAQGVKGDINHAVTVIGWGEIDPVALYNEDNALNAGCKDITWPLKYWIIQNSWGPGWGDCDPQGVGCGFMKIER